MITPTTSRPKRRRRRRCAVCNELFHELAPCGHCRSRRVCEGCLHPCPKCASLRCGNCERIHRCEHCEAPICTNESNTECLLCGEWACEQCRRACPCCELPLCSGCFNEKVRPCRGCKQPFCPECAGACEDSDEVCEVCWEDEELRPYCRRCFTHCPDCGVAMCPESEHRPKCDVCGNPTCRQSGTAWCQACDKTLCIDCTVRSYSGGMGGENVFCEKCARSWNAWPCRFCTDALATVQCSECGFDNCESCCEPCPRCDELVCKECEDRHLRDHLRDERRKELAESGSDEPCQRCRKRPVGTVCEKCYREICTHCARSCPGCEKPFCWRCLPRHKPFCGRLHRREALSA